MLTLGPTSTCDICFERFGPDSKAPCSIACGHVFCVGCIGQIETLCPLCPLCRSPFEKHSCVTLCVDLDVVTDEHTPMDSSEALRLQQAIASVADKGTTEPRLRQLIQECKTFLHGKPRHMYKELRVAHRMIAYLCEVRTTLRNTSRNFEIQTEELKQQAEEIQQLTAQKETLQKQLAELEDSQKYERERSRAVETNLRQHYENALMAYQSLVEMYNAVAKRHDYLNKQLEAVTCTPHSGDASSQSPAYSSLPCIPDKKAPDRMSLKGAALPHPDIPFLISPLPQFATPLPISNTSPFSFTPVPPLPELTDEPEDDDDEAADSEHEAATPLVVQEHIPGSNVLKRKPTFKQLSFHRTDGRSESILSRTAPYVDQRRARSGSNPLPTSRNHSPLFVHGPVDRSNASPPSPTKSATLSQPQHLSSSREGDTPFPSRASFSQNQDGGLLRTRLHDLLRDSAGISSSLPNMSPSHFPPSLTNREGSSSRISTPPSRSDPSNTPLASSSSDIAAPLPQTGANKVVSGVGPNCNSAPRQGFSSASTEAKKLEEERRRKLREEKQNSYSPNDMDREVHMSKQPSASTSTQSPKTTPLPTRREQPSNTTNPLLVPNSGSTSFTRRGSIGRSGLSMPLDPDDYDTLTHQARYVSIGKARAPIFTSVDPAGIYA